MRWNSDSHDSESFVMVGLVCFCECCTSSLGNNMIAVQTKTTCSKTLLETMDVGDMATWRGGKRIG